MERVDDQSEAKAGHQNVAVVESGMVLHRPPMRGIIDHPRFAVDRQGSDWQIDCSIIVVPTETIGSIDSPIAEGLDPCIAQAGFRVEGRRRFPVAEYEHSPILVVQKT